LESKNQPFEGGLIRYHAIYTSILLHFQADAGSLCFPGKA
jgi:hypothetical protein